jgi:hypothetical protein
MLGELEMGEAIARGYPPAVLYLRNDEVVTTEVCAFNYFSVFLKDHPDADCHIWLFDREGKQAGYSRRELGLNGQLQLQTSELCSRISGTVAMSLIPMQETKLRPGRKVTTGYYAQYFSQHGAITLSHEREPVAAAPFPTSAWMQSYLTRFLKESGVVLVNSCMASDGTSTGTARLMAVDGRALAERALPEIAPMGALRMGTLDLFPDAERLIGASETFALEFKGTNIASPFSYYEFANGKFSLHHF